MTNVAEKFENSRLCFSPSFFGSHRSKVFGRRVLRNVVKSRNPPPGLRPGPGPERQTGRAGLQVDARLLIFTIIGGGNFKQRLSNDAELH